MDIASKVLQTLYTAVEEVNEMRPGKPALPLEEDAVLFGPKGKLDSLGLVNLITTSESKIEDSFNLTISLMDERAMNQEKSPFKTLGSLAEYITLLINESLSDNKEAE